MLAHKERLSFPHTQPGSKPTRDEVKMQLDRILANPEFKASAGQRAMLEFVISETLAGRSHEIKAYTVATRVFGRSAEFDQATDPIVSIQANKLRRALERYYLIAGKNDPVRIDIPKGTYVPNFLMQSEIESNAGPSERTKPDINYTDTWPILMVRPFKNLTGDPEQNYLGMGFATELAVEITRYRDIRVILYEPGEHEERASDSVARFIIDGSIRKDISEIKVTVILIDTRNHTQIWGETFKSDLKAIQWISLQEHIAGWLPPKWPGSPG